MIYSKSTKDYKTKYDKSICDILDTMTDIKKPSTIKKEHDEERKNITNNTTKK